MTTMQSHTLIPHPQSIMHANKTKKVKKPDKIDKKALWANFDKEEREGAEKFENPIECVYRATGERELCECCQSTLSTTDEGFFCCTNRSCGSGNTSEPPTLALDFLRGAV